MLGTGVDMGVNASKGLGQKAASEGRKGTKVRYS